MEDAKDTQIQAKDQDGFLAPLHSFSLPLLKKNLR